MPQLSTLDKERQQLPLRSLLAGEPEFREVLGEYLATMPAKVQRLNTLMSEGRLYALQVEVHQLVGSGGSYGFPDLSNVALEVENACKAGDQEAAFIRAADLVELIGRLRGD